MGNRSGLTSISLRKLLTLVILVILILEIQPSTNLGPEFIRNASGSSFVETNFELSFLITTGSRIGESYALYIKQALAPLGIEVNFIIKPWGQFVGDFTRKASMGTPWDITTTSLSGGNPTPDLSWLYHSEGYWGSSIMQLGDPEFQSYQLLDVELNQTTDIDRLIETIDFELNFTRRYELLKEFNDLYFNKLLWNMPLIAQISKTSMWKGFGGPNNELWDLQEGIILSSFLGAGWNEADIPETRDSDPSTIRWAVDDQSKFNLDPFQSQDDQQASQTDWSYVGEFITFDKTNSPHPNVAWNWFSGDFGDTWVDDDNETIPVTQYTFLLRDDVYWHETVDIEGNVIPPKRVDGLDYNLTLSMYDMARQSNTFDLKDEDGWKVLADWNISSTIFPNDTISLRVPNSLRTPNDLFKFSSLNPLPSHLLGGDLTFYNSTSKLNETSPLVPGMPFDPWNTYQWNSFESFEGNTAIGPYQMVDYNFNIFHSFEARSDYWYPNEWDVATYYSANKENNDLMKLENKYDVNLSLWGADNSLPQTPYYHAWAENGGNMVKPTDLSIKFIEYVVIGNQDAELIKFEAGHLDIYESSQIGAYTVQTHTNNLDLSVKESFPKGSATLLFFNLANDHLKKINVRLAIAHVLDRDRLIRMHDGLGKAWWSVTFPNKQSNGIDWDIIQNPINYAYYKARDLMRLEGYDAADTNDFIPTGTPPDIYTDWEKGVINFIDYGTTFVLVVALLRKKKKNFR